MKTETTLNCGGRFGAKVAVVCGCLLAHSSFCAVAGQQNFTIEPVPDWTTGLVVEETNNPAEAGAGSGVFYLLFDVELNGATKERYIHIAEKFLSPSGVEANSRLSIEFDPSYQQLVIHKIVLHRGTEVMDQLIPERIRVIQQEKDLDRLIYNGALTAMLFLEDVRVGDWVEYAYTIRGRNPIDKGHYWDSLQLRWPFPVQAENYRLLWPVTNQPLWFQTSGDVAKNLRTNGLFFDYQWRWENRPGQEFEDMVPWTDIAYAMVHFSDYRHWSDVGEWAVGCFELPQTVSTNLYQKITRLREEADSDEERVVKALEFVQDGIRYLGIENGINSHQPTDPSTVYARGYGDCKDKVQLFCAIMRFFGIDASPVLVSTRFRHRVKSFIPTPMVFDHAIVQVVLEGRTYYVDPTRSFQRGPLARRFIDDFGEGLLLDAQQPGLITIPWTQASQPRSTLSEKYDVLTNAPATLDVTSVYEGRDADSIRQELAFVSRDLFEKSSLDYYQTHYTGIIRATPMEVDDDVASDRMEITQQFKIPKIWKAAKQTNFIACEFFSSGILERLAIPQTRERKLELALGYPANFTQRIEIQTHESWRVSPKDQTIENSSFHFHCSETCASNRITLVYELATRRPAVAASEVADYLAAVEKISNLLGLSVPKREAGSSVNGPANLTVWMGVICYTALLLIGATLAWRYHPKSPPVLADSSRPELKGLGGWLIVLGIALSAGILAHLWALGKASPVYSTESWRRITDSANNAYDSLLAPLLLFELFLQLTFLIFNGLVLVLFFQKRRTFPAFLMAYLCFQFVGVCLDFGGSHMRKTDSVITNRSAPAGSELIVKSFFPIIVWGLYLSRSRRAKLTFQK